MSNGDNNAFAAIPKDIKKSKFIAQNIFQAGDYLDFVRQNQNFRISYTDFIASLGVLGNLTPVGDVTAIPVYYLDGGVNKIRGVIGGSGIVASLSVGDAVQVSHNFTVDKTGAPILANETAISPTFRSLQAGSGITVAAAGNNIIISTSGTPGTTKTVNVFQESDFPTAVGGVITLADNTEYRMLNDVTTANRFVLGDNTILTGADEDLIHLTYTGALTMFTMSDNLSNNFRGITFNCTTAAAFLSFSSTGGTDSFYMSNVDVNCATFGTFTNVNICLMERCQLSATVNGITFAGTCGLLYLAVELYSLPSAAAATAINLGTSVWSYINLENIVFNMNDPTSYCIAGAVNNGNLTATGHGIVSKCHQLGSGTFLLNISPFDDRWEFALNTNAVNSADVCLMSNTGATITISTAGVPVIVDATWVEQTAHRFTTTAGGRFTYTGKGADLFFTASISADIPSGVDNISFFLYKNGVQIPASRVIREIDSGNIGNASLIWADEAATNDYYELWVQNDDTSVNIIISSVALRINS